MYISTSLKGVMTYGDFFYQQDKICLEDHLMGELSLAQAEDVLHVSLKHGGIRVLGNNLEDLLVDGSLVGLALLGGLVLLLLSLEDISLFLGGFLVAGKKRQKCDYI